VKYLPLVILLLIFVGMITITRRNRQRAAVADHTRKQQLGPGTEVMTTSGQYGTVVAVNPDDTALLSVAPGVEVRWSIAALRVPAELPQRYRGPIAGDEPGQAELPNDSNRPAEPDQS